jgi:tripartite-type tricarboxylate transporter receptor subunit TctC
MRTALLGGNVDSIQIAYSTIKGYLKPGGGMRPLVTFAPERWRELPNIPTAREKGYDINRASWFYLLAAKGTPQPVLKILGECYEKTVQDPDVEKKLIKMGFTPLRLGPEQTMKKIQSEFKLTKEVFKKVGL